MNKALMPRKAREGRSFAAPLPDFETLDHAHQSALRMLESFNLLLVQLQDEGLGGPARASAQQILAFFNGPGRHHHDDEEERVFPHLLASNDSELVAQVKCLQQDHHWLEEDWRELAPHVKAVAEGYNGYDLPMLTVALPVFDALYRDHIALEETRVYPAAKRLQQALPPDQDGKNRPS